MNIYNLFKNTVNRFTKDINKIQTHIDNQVNDIMDYIVEETSVGSWTYRKWASGVAEAWLTNYNLGKLAMTNGYGSSYYYAVQDMSYPSGLFISAPSTQINPYAEAGLINTSIYVNTKDKFNVYFSNSLSVSNYNIWVNVYARGYWKEYSYPASPAPIIQPIDPPTGAGDWVVSSGQSGIWTYQKWNSGIAECWGHFIANTAWSKWGNIYQGTPSPQYATFPTNFFINTPTINVDCFSEDGNSGTMGVEYFVLGTKDRTPNIYALRPDTGYTPNNFNVIFDIRARGFWKTFTGGGN